MVMTSQGEFGFIVRHLGSVTHETFQLWLVFALKKVDFVVLLLYTRDKGSEETQDLISSCAYQ